MDRRNIKKYKKLYIQKYIMANTSAIWQQAAHTTYQLSSPSCSKRAIQKSLTLNEKYLRVFWKKVRRMDHQQKKMTRQKEQKDQAEKTREEIGKGNQMTALRFQTGRGHQTSPASLRGQTERQRQRETEAHSSQNKQTSDSFLKSQSLQYYPC